MAFTVEDGTGLADANSYVTEDDADAYHEDRGNTAWESVSEKEPVLVRATAAIDALYGFYFTGTRVNGRDQALEWPRNSATDRYGNIINDDEIPTEIQKAVFELALREGIEAGSAIPDLERAIRRVRAGSVEVEFASNAAVQTIYQLVSGILAPLIGTPGGRGLFGEVSRG